MHCLIRVNFIGYVIHFKKGDGDWEEREAEALASSFILQGLGCGGKYQIYLTALNKIGTGLPSAILRVSTKGSSKL